MPRRYRLPRRIWFLLALVVAAVIGGVVAVRHTYYDNLKPVNNNQSTQIFTVPMGSSAKEIAKSLETVHLIRSAWAFQLYVHSKELNDQLQAGTYAFSPSQDTPAIVSTLTKGKVETKLVTILPGRRIDQVRADFINAGFAPADVDRALNPSAYSDLPVLAFKPPDVTTLEGLLWPDSYQKQPNTDPSVIIRQSLAAMGDHLTTDLQSAFAAQGLTTYRGLILASIILREVNKPADQAQAAQVFLTRLKAGNRLESDATAHYGAVIAGREPSLTYESPYNTYQHGDLPPGPISTINASSLAAAAHPAATSWLYFVSGDDGTTYFSTTLEDHQALVQKYCHRLCSE